MDSEVKLFLIIGCVFLCVGYVLMKLFYVTEPNDLLHCVIDGMHVNDRLDTVLDETSSGPLFNFLVPSFYIFWFLPLFFGSFLLFFLVPSFFLVPFFLVPSREEHA